MTATHLDPAGSARYILSLGSSLQALVAGRQRAAHALIDLIDTSPLIAAVHLPVAAPAGDTILLAAAIAARLKRTGMFVEVDISRKHPVNVARSLVSLSHLTAHRIGWSLSAVPAAAVARNNRWLTDAPPSAGEASARQEFADLVIDLARSWPYESLIGDRERGWYNVEGSIRPIFRSGHFSVEGSLNMPGVPYGAIPFLSFDADPELKGHLRVGPEAVAGIGAAGAGLDLFPVFAPSSAGIGASSERDALYYVAGLRDVEQLSLLKRSSELALPEGNPKQGSIWYLLGVRPSVARLS